MSNQWKLKQIEMKEARIRKAFEEERASDMMRRRILPAGPIRRGGIGFNRKMDGKGSEYRPGVEVPVEVPAIEESLLNLDEELV